MQKGYWVSCYREIFDADKLAGYAASQSQPLNRQAGGFWCGELPSMRRGRV